MKQVYKNDVKEFIIKMKYKLSDPFYSGVAAELAFFFLWSLVPTVLLLGQLSGLFSISINFIIEILNTYAPKEFLNIVMPYLLPNNYKDTNILFLVFTLWLSSKGFFSIITISNYAYKIKTDTIFNINIREILAAMRLTFVLIFLILFGLLIPVYGRLIGDIISNSFLILIGVNYKIDKFWYLLRWPISFIVFYYIMIFVYSSSPNKNKKAWQVRPGALFCTIGLIISSLIFSFYVSKIANYDIIYGSFTSFIILMFWFYIIGNIIVIGLHINVITEEMKKERNVKNLFEYIKLHNK